RFHWSAGYTPAGQDENAPGDELITGVQGGAGWGFVVGSDRRGLGGSGVGCGCLALLAGLQDQGGGDSGADGRDRCDGGGDGDLGREGGDAPLAARDLLGAVASGLALLLADDTADEAGAVQQRDERRGALVRLCALDQHLHQGLAQGRLVGRVGGGPARDRQHAEELLLLLLQDAALDQGREEVLLGVLRDGLDDLAGGRLGRGEDRLQGGVEGDVARRRVVGDEDRRVPGLLALLARGTGLRAAARQRLVGGGEVGQEGAGEAHTQVVDVGELARLVVDGEQEEVSGNRHAPMLYAALYPTRTIDAELRSALRSMVSLT